MLAVSFAITGKKDIFSVSFVECEEQMWMFNCEDNALFSVMVCEMLIITEMC